MSRLGFPIDSDDYVVIDSSVIINLVATESVREIAQGFPNAFLVTTYVGEELSRDQRGVHEDAEKLALLVKEGIIEVVDLSSACDKIFRDLTDGELARTLDDGEAATIAYAVMNDAAAMIDERKARSICAKDFPELKIASTVELLADRKVEAILGRQGQIDAILAALLDARMNVPNELSDELIELIGLDRASRCPSLRRAVRRYSATRRDGGLP